MLNDMYQTAAYTMESIDLGVLIYMYLLEQNR